MFLTLSRHVLYAFANVDPESGEVQLSDAWADKDIQYDGDEGVEGDLYGNLKALYLLKKEHRHLKVLLSIGGWTNSPNIHPVIVDGDKRATFVESAVRILEDYGLDGIDVDYEYPDNDEQACGYVDLLRELREALDGHAGNKDIDYHFLLSVRCFHVWLIERTLNELCLGRSTVWSNSAREAPRGRDERVLGFLESNVLRLL